MLSKHSTSSKHETSSVTPTNHPSRRSRAAGVEEVQRGRSAVECTSAPKRWIDEQTIGRHPATAPPPPPRRRDPPAGRRVLRQPQSALRLPIQLSGSTVPAERRSRARSVRTPAVAPPPRLRPRHPLMPASTFTIRPFRISNVSNDEQKLFSRELLTMHRQCLNHSCLRNRLQLDISNHPAPGPSVLHGRSTHNALQIRAPRHLRHPVSSGDFAPAHPGSSRSGRGTRHRGAGPGRNAAEWERTTQPLRSVPP